MPNDQTNWGYHFSGIRFSDETYVSLTSQSVVLIVGPNNAGKSPALRELMTHLQPRYDRQPEPKVVIDVDVSTQGGIDDLEGWLKEHAFARSTSGVLQYKRPGAEANWQGLKEEWEEVLRQESGDHPARARIGQLWPFIVFHAAAEQRLGLLSDVAPYDPTSESPANPLQALFARPVLEQQLSEDAKEAFGTGVVLSRIWGSNLRLHMGSLDRQATLPPSEDYMNELASLPLATEQGDGVKSFLGLLLALRAAGYPIVMVDEPEAFLHPPQARLLGRKLVSRQLPRTQVFIATHNSDVVRGVLDGQNSDVQIVRIVRDNDINVASVLSAEDLRKIWADPILRYSNVLEGLFHKGVILSEGDSDSQFYSAVLDSVRERAGAPPHDLLFTQSNGKERLPTALEALRSLAVPAAVVVDFDVLREAKLLRKLVEILGGDWDNFDRGWRNVNSAIEQVGRAPLLTDVREEIEAGLATVDGELLTPDGAARVRKAVQLTDSWRMAKRGGLSVLPQGPVFEEGEDLLRKLRQGGIFVVPVGELERWVPSIPNKGPRWVGDALEGGAHLLPGAPVSDFIVEVAAWLDSPC